MDERNLPKLPRRKDSRLTTLGLGLCCTLALAAALRQEADARSRRLLSQSHHATRELLVRDVEALRKKLSSGLASTDPTAVLPEPTLTFARDVNGLLTLRDEKNAETTLPAGTNLNELFSADLRDSGPTHHELRGGEEETTLGARGPERGSAVEADASIPGTNLTLHSTLALAVEQARANRIVAGMGAFWMLLLAGAHWTQRRRRRWQSEAAEWIENAFLDLAEGREPAPLHDGLLNREEAALLLRIQAGLARRGPSSVVAPAPVVPAKPAATVPTTAPVAFVPPAVPPAPAPHDPAARLVGEDSFRQQLGQLGRPLREGEHFVLGKIQLRENGSLSTVATALSRELALAGEYIQWAGSARTLVYALRAPDQESLLFGTFGSLRSLAEEGTLRAGAFAASLHVRHAHDPHLAPAALLPDLLAEGAALPAESSQETLILRPHLKLREREKETTFTLAQILYVDGEASASTATEPEKKSEGKRARSRKAKARNSLGRKPSLPPPPSADTWN